MYTANVINGLTPECLFDRHRVALRKRGFIWRAYLLAYSNESAEIYRNIEKQWNELDAITGEGLAFVFANECASNILHFGYEMRRERYLPQRGRHTIAEANSALVERFKELHSELEYAMPCLVIENLISNNSGPIIIRLSNNADISSIMKYISIRTEGYLTRIKEIKTTIEREHLRNLEYYYDVKKRIIRIMEDCGISGEEVSRLLQEYELNSNSYTEQRLREMWLNAVNVYRRPIFGDKNGNLILRLFILKNEIPNFCEKYERYEELVKKIDYLLQDLQNAIETIDIHRCKKDAITYARKMLNKVDDILKKNDINTSLRNDIHDELLMRIENSDCYEVSNAKIVDKIRNSKAVALLDDYSRLVTLINIITTIGNLISHWQ